MSVLNISSFGGEMPSASARALPNGAARSSTNLLATSNEFRPLAGDVTVATPTATAGLSLYRLSRSAGGAFNTNMATGWISTAIGAEYVKGQVDDNLTERTYVTASDGSVAPLVFDNLGATKSLGVPAPAKPVCSLNVVLSYTPEQDALARKTIPLEIFNAIKASLGGTILGDAPPTLGSGVYAPGWVPHGTATSPALPTTNPGEWAFMMPMSYQALTSTYALDATIFGGLSDYLLEPEFLGRRVVYGGTNYWAFPVTLQGIGYIVNSATLTSGLQAIRNPSNTALQLIPNGNIATTVANIVADYAVTTAPQANAIALLQTARAAVALAIDTSNNASLLASGISQDQIGRSHAVGVLKALGELKTAARRVTSDYDAINVRLAELVTSQTFYNNGIAAFLPEVATRIIDTRFYVVTFITSYGEESAPSPVSDQFDVDQNDNVSVNRPAVPSGYGITTWRIYRSNTSSAATQFQYVMQLPVSFALNNDGLTAAALGEPVTTTGWAPPPANLRGLCGIAGGIMAGYFDNTVCFCESNAPHAWPFRYQQYVKFPITGMLAFGQTLFVGTRGSPYLFSGASPASMSPQELPSSQACVSSRSIVSLPNGVLYASPDGICMAGYNGVVLVSANLFSREDWQALNPSSIIAALHDNVYYFIYNTGTATGCYALDFTAGKLTKVALAASALFVDQITDTLYLLNGATIQAVFTTGRRTGIYRTGIIKLDRQQPLAWLQVDSDFSAPVTVLWYGDGVLRYTATLTSITPVRLPSGRYLEHEIEVQGTARVTRVMLASTTAELQAL